ncbi:hypothetical protein N9Z27_02260 [Alphaproteobacteria bacterium]|nr:hypothetical protein [Alphaproteobacteria bacterium]
MWKKQDGLSLLETTILLLVLGLLLLPILHLQTINRKYEVVANTESNIHTLKSALRQYAMRNGRYPRPAARNLNETDATFGQEAAVTGNCAGDDATPCRIAGAHDPDDDGAGTNGPYPNTVLIGDIPFASLGVPQHFIVDGWGSKFTYAISEGLTQTGPAMPFDETMGVIKITSLEQKDVPGVDDDRLNTSSDAHFVIISHGSNQRGAWSISGQLISPCDPATPAREVENCNYNVDATFTDNSVTHSLVAGDGTVLDPYEPFFSYANNADYFDDYIGFDVSISGNIWSKNNTDIAIDPSPDIFSRGVRNIRIGQVPDNLTEVQKPYLQTPQTSMEVIGDVIADELHVNTLCSYPSNRLAAGNRYACLDKELIQQAADAQQGSTPNERRHNYAKFVEDFEEEQGNLFSMLEGLEAENLQEKEEGIGDSDMFPYVFTPSIIGGHINKNNDGDSGTDAEKFGAGIYCGDRPLVGIKAVNEICDTATISGQAAANLTAPCPTGEFLRGMKEEDGQIIPICCFPGEECN